MFNINANSKKETHIQSKKRLSYPSGLKRLHPKSDPNISYYPTNISQLESLEKIRNERITKNHKRCTEARMLAIDMKRTGLIDDVIRTTSIIRDVAESASNASNSTMIASKSALSAAFIAANANFNDETKSAINAVIVATNSVSKTADATTFALDTVISASIKLFPIFEKEVQIMEKE